MGCEVGAFAAGGEHPEIRLCPDRGIALIFPWKLPGPGCPREGFEVAELFIYSWGSKVLVGF